MSSARSVVLSICASVAALAALALGAQAASPSSAAPSIIDIAFASDHGFQHPVSLKSATYTGLNEVSASVFADGVQMAAAGEQAGMSRISLQSGVTTSLDQFADQRISPALSAGFALRRGWRGVDTVEF